MLFGFDYMWKVYKPEHQRKFGYYTLPILWGSRLVGRLDSRLDRTIHTFVILGLWLEDEALSNDETFAEALTRGLVRFLLFLGGASWMQRRFVSRGSRQRAYRSEYSLPSPKWSGDVWPDLSKPKAHPFLRYTALRPLNRSQFEAIGRWMSALQAC